MSDKLREVDARGLACPQPVINTKKALDDITDGTVVVIVDNATARENVLKFAASQGCGAVVETKGGCHYIRITKGHPQEPVAPAVVAPAATTDCAVASGPVYLFTKNTLGSGNDELGGILLKSFFHTLVEGDLIPRAVLFVNSGVFLALEGSPVLADLKALAERGVTVLSCGTCLDYYQVKARLAVGSVTNMYTIASYLHSGARVVTL